ncbi:taste receptor type 2 member 19-like [Dama dama]|uniref:taste receptor type 2 member 19-like n=1 Tax=Dama dama TaxID=30532 RepID=UPI002A37242D|nr:taste receptor type 2 member 19-like [Dama dama]
MITLVLSILSILSVTEFVLGNFANGFIALVNCNDWVRRQKISSADGLLTALAVCRIFLLWTILINWYATMYNPALYSLRIIIHVAWTVSNHFSNWLATSLSIFYLLKIANFSSLIFFHLKWRVKSVVLMMMLGASVILLFEVAVSSIDETIQTSEYERNITEKTKLRDILHLSNMTLLTLTNFIPFTVSLTSFLLLIFSLWKHLRKMKLNHKGSQDPSTKVHIKAMQTVISFLFLFAIFTLTVILTIWNSNELQKELVRMLFQAFAITYPSMHSFFLIWTNRKLKQTFLSFLWQPRCSLKIKGTR